MAAAAAKVEPDVSEPVWRDRARFRDLRSVVDPADAHGNKNLYIDHVHKLALGRRFRLRRSDVVLDFGCGIGRFTDWLEARAGSVIGIDSVAEMIDAAKELHPRSRCRWLTFSGRHLPLEDASVDRVLSVFVLQHVLDETVLRDLVDEFHRVLRRGGSVALIEQVLPNQSQSVPGYIEQRTTREYVDVFQAAGFYVAYSHPIRAPWRIASAVVRRRVPGFMLWAVAAATLIRARKLTKAGAYADQLMIFNRNAT